MQRQTKTLHTRAGYLLMAALALAMVACSSTSRRSTNEFGGAPQSSFGAEVALRAIAQIGRPYVYGGADLHGFDCSGLVYYIHHELGVAVPRTAADQYDASHHVKLDQLAPGDLVFFRTTASNRVTHVGIYAGEGRFVHSPQSGRAIELRELDDDYYGPRIVGAGRYTSAP